MNNLTKGTLIISGGIAAILGLSRLFGKKESNNGFFITGKPYLTFQPDFTPNGVAEPSVFMRYGIEGDISYDSAKILSLTSVPKENPVLGALNEWVVHFNQTLSNPNVFEVGIFDAQNKPYQLARIDFDAQTVTPIIRNGVGVSGIGKKKVFGQATAIAFTKH